MDESLTSKNRRFKSMDQDIDDDFDDLQTIAIEKSNILRP